MVKHLQDAALNPLHIQGKETEHDEPEVGNGGEGNQAFQVFLDHADQGSIDDADDGQDGDQGNQLVRSLGEERDAEPQEPVGSHLQEDCGQQDGPHGRGFGVGIGQPGMEGEHGNLDGEGQAKSQEQPELDVLRDLKL